MGLNDGRSYVQGNFAWTLDGVDCGYVPKVEGGDIEAEYATLPHSSDYFVYKHITNVKYNPVKVQLGVSMTKVVQDWIDASLGRKYQRKSGDIAALNFRLEEMFVREFKDALLTEITFPACDASGKDPGFMTLGFQPWIMRERAGGGGQRSNAIDPKQKAWTPQNFKFTLDGLDDKANSKIAKVNATTIKQTTARDFVGTESDYFDEPGHVEFQDVEITLPQAHADTLYKWHEEFIINKNNTADQHRSASLEFLNQNRQQTLVTLTFSGLGITKISNPVLENNKDGIASVTAKMYCERVEVKFA
jgi:hypothetical protein